MRASQHRRDLDSPVALAIVAFVKGTPAFTCSPLDTPATASGGVILFL